MNNQEVAAILDGVIVKMFINFNTLTSDVAEYSILHFSKISASWFIVLFFLDKNKFKTGLKNGVCFEIYSYLYTALVEATNKSNIELSIFFELGNRPKETKESDNLFRQLLKKQKALSGPKEQGNDCSSCGHIFNDHQLLWHINENNSAPTGGWMICPVEDCNCFQVWNADLRNI